MARRSRTLIALQTKMRPEQVGPAETIDGLFDGVSSRRNQVLMDIGAEFDAGSIDRAHEVPVAELAARAGGPRTGLAGAWGLPHRGACRCAEAGAGTLGAERARRGDLPRSDVRLRAGARDGGVRYVGARDAAAGASARGGDLGTLGDAAPATKDDARALLDAVVGLLGKRRGQSFGRLGAVAGPGRGRRRLAGAERARRAALRQGRCAARRGAGAREGVRQGARRGRRDDHGRACRDHRRARARARRGLLGTCAAALRRTPARRVRVVVGGGAARSRASRVRCAQWSAGTRRGQGRAPAPRAARGHAADGGDRALVRGAAAGTGQGCGARRRLHDVLGIVGVIRVRGHAAALRGPGRARHRREPRIDRGRDHA